MEILFLNKLILADLQKEVKQRIQTQNERNNFILLGNVKDKQEFL